METNSSGEDLIVKARKPYTITKQREKWTEEEHNKFIEALKLYGRAWQRIEEHIGTKTAVQIRSHAQKFFTKVEREALMKGIPFGQAHDIEIPPPRPKRKPASPYPRKTGVVSFSLSPVGGRDDKTSKSPLSVCKQATFMDNNAPCKIQGREDNSEDGCRSEVLNLFQDAPTASVSSFNKSSSNPSAFKGFVPLTVGIKDKIILTRSSVVGIKDKIILTGSSVLNDDKDPRVNETVNRDHQIEDVNGIHIDRQTNSAQNGAVVSGQPEKVDLPVVESKQGDESFSKHGSVLKQSSNKNIQMTVTDQAGVHVNTKPSFSPTMSSTSELHTNSGLSSIHQSFPASPPFIQFPRNHDSYISAPNFSSSYSSLIVSSLLQNPAVHAAACLAASFWPSVGTDASLDSTSETLPGGIPARHMNPSPSMAAIAAATVAAASACWAAQGLLPVFPPVHPGFAFAPAPMTTINTLDISQVPEDGKEEKGDALHNFNGVVQQVVEPEQSEALKAHYPSSKPLLSSSDSDGRNDMNMNSDKLKPSKNDKFHYPGKASCEKKLDRSSCGSNTSGSELETDALEKQNKVDDEAKQIQFHQNEENDAAKQVQFHQNEEDDDAKQVQFDNLLSGETNTRRVRCSVSSNEFWKEVSEEGRIAFQALFTRQVLPQSFSPPHLKYSVVKTGEDDEEAVTELPVDLNMMACPSEPISLSHVHGHSGTMGKGGFTSENSCGKLKVRRTGFKPYKRCSVEAKESRAPTGEEECGNKRIRLEGESSI